MTSHRSFRTIAGAAAFALATAFGSQLALAQPAGPHGPHGAAGPDEMIGHLIASTKAQLNLNTSQQGMFDKAVADSKAAMQSGRALHQKVRDTLNAELAKAEPDLGAVAAAGDAAADQARAQHKSIRAEWLALYATFTPDQKTVVKAALQDHLAKADSFREKMHERMKSKHAGTAG